MNELLFAGERPFLCKVCNMSFTTNGNMHRHTRIHEKELENGLPGSGPRIRAPAKRKSNAQLSKNELDIAFTPEKRKMTEEFVDASYLQLTQRALPMMDSSDSSLPSSPVKPISYNDISPENMERFSVMNVQLPSYESNPPSVSHTPVKNEEVRLIQSTSFFKV